MKDELTGRVGCVKTRKEGDDVVQNFALCVEQIVDNGIPRMHTEWHNVVARNLPQVKGGDNVTIIGLTRNAEYVRNDGFIRTLRVFVVDRLTINSHEVQ